MRPLPWFARLFACALPALALLPSPGCGAQESTPASDVGLSVGRERLSNGSPDWSDTQLQFNHRFAPRHLAGVTLAHTERFGLRDNQLGLSYVLPLQKDWTLALDANASGTHRVLPRHAFGVVAQFEFAPAWLLHGGLRTTSYDAVTVNQGVLMLERYAGSMSASLAWRPAHAYGTTAHAWEARASYYYGDRSSAGLILASGKEAASIGPTVAITGVDAIALVGRHWFNSQWGVNGAITRTRQGDFYFRNGINLGLQYAF
jgi:YaiO family outer membrane protein